MNRNDMLLMLHELDKELSTSLTIEICGSSCAILNFGLNRSSTDIDILRSSVDLSDKTISDAIHIVADRTGTDKHWLNDKAKDFLKIILDEFKTDVSPISGEEFKHLRVLTISKADFVITKLAYHSYIRQHDITDLKSLDLKNYDVENIYKKLDSIAKNNPFDALMIEGNFKSIRQDLVKDSFGHSYTTVNDITNYSEKRYGIAPSNETIENWKDTIELMPKKTSSIIASIDISAAKLVKEGNNQIVSCDIKYRIQRIKDFDYGYNL
jgi:hypothetical protein